MLAGKLLLPSIVFLNKICVTIMIFTAFSRLIHYMRRGQLDYMLLFKIHSQYRSRTFSIKNVFLEISQNSEENTLCLRPATLLKKTLCHRCFPEHFAKFIRTPFYSTPPDDFHTPWTCSCSLSVNPWKTSATWRFSDVFRGYRKATTSCNGLIFWSNLLLTISS